MNSTIARIGATSAMAASLLTTTVLSAPALAQQAVTVVVNGQTVGFDQPPIERAGRVFVPLRGVFERLGASVVYSDGVINATGNGRNISLKIGSTQATINGQTQYVDVAPFLVGARTLVPLRFVAQALGANVDWNGNTHTVTINGSGGGGAPAQSTPPPNQSFNLQNVSPTGSVATLTPALHAKFSEPIQRDTLHVYLDGNDLTSQVYVNPNGFDVTPESRLSAGTHRVRVTGQTQAGASFNTGWSFTAGANGGVSDNFIRNIQPTPGTQVPGNFNLSGRTLPGSRVHIVASGSAQALGGILVIGTGAFQTDVTADGNGVFSAGVTLNNVSGSQIRVIIQSVAPNGASAERSFQFTM